MGEIIGFTYLGVAILLTALVLTGTATAWHISKAGRKDHRLYFVTTRVYSADRPEGDVYAMACSGLVVLSWLWPLAVPVGFFWLLGKIISGSEIRRLDRRVRFREAVAELEAINKKLEAELAAARAEVDAVVPDLGWNDNT